MKTHIIMQLVTESKWFKESGQDVPMPLAEINGHPMFVEAMECLNVTRAETISFIVWQEHIDKYSINKTIKIYYPNANIIPINSGYPINGGSAGIAELVDSAALYLLFIGDAEAGDALVVADYDTVLKSKEWKCMTTASDGAVVILFQSTDKNNYYADIKDGYLDYVSKTRISANAVSGPYWFSSIKMYRDACAAMRTKYKEDGTLKYKVLDMPQVYNFIVGTGNTVYCVDTGDKTIHMGTPEGFAEAGGKIIANEKM